MWENVISDMMFLKITKEICDTLKEVYRDEKNISKYLNCMSIYLLFNRGTYLFLNIILHSKTLHELDAHQSLVTDLKTLK